MIDFLANTPWVQQIGLIGGGFLLGLLTEWILAKTLHVIAKRTASTWDDLVVHAIRRMPVVWWTAAGIWAALLVRGVDANTYRIVTQGLVVALITSFTIVASRLAAGSVDRYAARSTRLPSTSLVTNLVKLLIGTIGLFLVLQNLNIGITPLITAMGIGGLAVALALQDTLSNLFAGIAIILSGQLRPGDYVRMTDGDEGFVADVKARNTTIRTFPFENIVVIPNSVLASSIVTNFNLPQKSLWINVPVGVSYDSDLQQVEQVAIEVGEDTLKAVESSHTHESPIIRYQEFGDSSINFDVLLFVSEFKNQFIIRHEFIKNLHARFNKEKIEIPFPIRTVHLHNAP